jgi:hypothetical protein
MWLRLRAFQMISSVIQSFKTFDTGLATKEKKGSEIITFPFVPSRSSRTLW